MKAKEFKELKKKEIKELVKLEGTKKFEAQKAKLNTVSGKEKNLKIYRNLRRDIAQIATVIKEMQIVESLKAMETK